MLEGEDVSVAGRLLTLASFLLSRWKDSHQPITKWAPSSRTFVCKWLAFHKIDVPKCFAVPFMHALPICLLALLRTVPNPLAGTTSFQVRCVGQTTNAKPTSYRQKGNVWHANAYRLAIQLPLAVGIVRVKAHLHILNTCRWSFDFRVGHLESAILVCYLRASIGLWGVCQL